MTQPDATSAPPWLTEPYSIKRHGVTITSCDAEPVQTPGCIQAHGVLLVLRSHDLTVTQASESTARWLGREPEALLGAACEQVLGADATARVRTLLGEPLDGNPTYACTLDAREGRPALDVLVHTAEQLVLVELEPALGDARGEGAPYAQLQRSVARLQTGRTLREYCQIVCEEVRTLTGLDRVMVYKFHEDGHGEVFAESRRDDLSSWLGLHYPAEDIPLPAREVFRRTWVRPVPDVGAELAEVVPLANPDTGRPLLMTHCVLRGPSVMYTEYLANMGVRAALTLSIRRDDQLWGLIACHHYAGTKYLSHQTRAACELFAQVVSLQHRAAEEREFLTQRLETEGVRQALVEAAHAGGLAKLAEGRPTLLDVVPSTGAALYHAGAWSCLGTTPGEEALAALATFLRARPELGPGDEGVYVTDSLSRAWPEAERWTAVASGVLALSLPKTEWLLVWFRPEILQTVTWAGNPEDKPTVVGPNGPRLTPRASFALFVESVRQRAAPWRWSEVESARRLRRALIELVLGQAAQLAEANAHLARVNEELDAFAYVASHDLKEPLRGIFKYAHQLSEAAASGDDEGKNKLAGIMRLTTRMNGLLDALLQFSRVGRVALQLESVDLGEVVDEAIEMVDARRGEVPTEIVIPRPLPAAQGDRVRIREIFVNLLSNALKYNDKPKRVIEIGYVGPSEAGARGEAPREADGCTVYYVRDNGIGIAQRHQESVFRIFQRLHARDAYGGGSGAGLTIVKRLVQRHDGQIWMTSHLGQGTTFFFTLEGSLAP